MELKFLETVKFKHKLSLNYFVSQYSEHDCVFVLTDAGVYIIKLKCPLLNQYPTLSCSQFFFELAPYDIPCKVNIDTKMLSPELARDELYEFLLRTELSTGSKLVADTKYAPITAEWSPKGATSNAECLLGVLSNVYDLQIYHNFIDENSFEEFKLIGNLTDSVVAERQNSWKYADKLPPNVKFAEYKRRIEAVACSAFTWGHLIEIEGIHHLIVFMGHLDGALTIWRFKKLEPTESEVNFQFAGRFQTEFGCINYLNWKRTSGYGGVLSIGSRDGRMAMMKIENLNGEAIKEGEIIFWDDCDNLKVDKISIIDYKSCNFVILIKKSFLIMYFIKEGLVSEQKILNLGNFQVTEMIHFDNKLLILSLNGHCKLLTLNYTTKIEVEESVVSLNFDSKQMRTGGMFASRNNALIGVVSYPMQMKNIIREKQPIQVNIYCDKTVNIFKVLTESNASLESMWDYVEALRLSCYKDKTFPWHGIDPDLNYDTLTLQELKTYRIIAKISEDVFDTVQHIYEYNIKPFTDMQYLVDIRLAVERIKKLLQIKSCGQELSLFQMQSIDIQNFFLKEMVLEDVLVTCGVGLKLVEEISEVMAICNELAYPDMPDCLWCGEKLIGPTCFPPHPDSRCCLSLMPIRLQTPYFKCHFCKYLVNEHMEKELDEMICPYCDHKLYKMTAYQEPVITYGEIIEDEKVNSVCGDDCLKEVISNHEIGIEEAVDLTLLSDEDSEPQEFDYRVRDLYLRFLQINLNDVINEDEVRELI